MREVRLLVMEYLDSLTYGFPEYEEYLQEVCKENADKYALSPQLVRIFQNTVPLVHDSFSGLNNQNDACPPQEPDIPQQEYMGSVRAAADVVTDASS
jgi:hypothetical protein